MSRMWQKDYFKPAGSGEATKSVAKGVASNLCMLEMFLNDNGNDFYIVQSSELISQVTRELKTFEQ